MRLDGSSTHLSAGSPALPSKRPESSERVKSIDADLGGSSMAVATSYPGVYVEEIPSGVHTITGVATSITTFIGWAAQGPTQYAGLVQSWTDFQRIYGGFDARSPYLGYAVSQFFINGGQQAYIVRLAYTGPTTATLAPAGSAS